MECRHAMFIFSIVALAAAAVASLEMVLRMLRQHLRQQKWLSIGGGGLWSLEDVPYMDE